VKPTILLAARQLMLGMLDTAPHHECMGRATEMLANIDFIGATVKPSQVNFLSSAHPLSTGGFV
jgi:hypothetical protein